MSSINQLFQEDSLQEVIEQMLSVENIPDEERDSLKLLSARLATLERQENRRTIHDEYATVQRNGIREAILNINHRIPGEKIIFEYKSQSRSEEDNKYSNQFNLSAYLKDIPSNYSEGRNFSMFDIPQNLINKINENRIILIACPYEKLIENATYGFIHNYENHFTPFIEKKYLRGANLNQSGSMSADNREEMKSKDGSAFNKASPVSIDLGMFLSEKMAKNQLIVIDLIDGDLSQNFLKSMTTRYIGIANAKEELTRNNNLLVVNISGKDISGKENQDLLEELENHLWQVPFLSSYLKRYDQQHLEEKLVIQQKNKLWLKDLYEFYHELKPYLQNRTLEAECQKRESGTNDEVAGNKKEAINLILEKEKKPLRRYLIFLIAFFGEIPDDDFDYLLHTLIKGDKKLLKDYNKGYKKLLKDCHIQRMSNNEDDFTDMVLDFSKLDYRNQAIRYFFFDDFQFIRIQCNTLLLQGLLIQQEPSYPAYRNLVKLLGRVSKASTGYALKLLKSLLAAIFTEKASIDTSLSEDQIYDILKQKSDDGGLNWLDLHGYGILVELIQEMSYHDRLIQDIKEFYDFLISNRLHNIALRVVDFMPFSNRIDKIEWLRRLINNGVDSIKEEAFKRLINFTPRNAEQLHVYLNRLYEWLPSKETDPVSYSPANKFALKFILNYLYRAYEAIGSPFSNYGTNRSSYPLFALVQDTQLGSDEWLKKLIDWLFHPHIASAVNDGKEDITTTKKRYYFDVAILIEHWYAILHGLSREANYPNNLEIFDRITNLICPKIKEDRIIYQSLVHVWNQNAKGYEAEMQYYLQIGKFITDVELKKAIEQNKQEVAARRYLLIEKFIPTIKKKLDPLVTNSQN